MKEAKKNGEQKLDRNPSDMVFFGLKKEPVPFNASLKGEQRSTIMVQK